MGRLPFPNHNKYCPPFTATEIGVDAFDPSSFVQVAPAQVSPGVTADPDALPIQEPFDTSRYASFRPSDFIAASGNIPFRGGVHGDIAYRGLHGWVLLPAAESGKVLKTNDIGRNPSWEDA